MTACVICGRRCVPMADYDAPVCARCDAAQDDILAAAALAAYLAPPTTVQVVRTPAPRCRCRNGSVVVHADLTRPVETYYGPAAPEVIAELVDALFPQYSEARRSA